MVVGEVVVARVLGGGGAGRRAALFQQRNLPCSTTTHKHEQPHTVAYGACVHTQPNKKHPPPTQHPPQFGDFLRTRVKLSMAEQIAAAMAELAREGVLHRDLAVRNVLVASIDPVHVKVSDFGLARQSSSSRRAPLSPAPPAARPRASMADG